MLELTALRGDDTLGFLAALGLQELCSTALARPASLGWDAVTLHARLDVPYDTTDTLAAALAGLAGSWIEEGRLTPTDDLQLIRPPLTTRVRKAMDEAGALDPMRMETGEALARYGHQQGLDLAAVGTSDARWLAALVNQLAPVSRTDPKRRLSPLYSPSGQMTIHQLFRDLRDEVARRPQALLEALIGWRRTAGSGANLDARALVDSAAASGKQSENRHVAGATWLALQSIPMFLQSGDGRAGSTWGWARENRDTALVWPVWTSLLDRHAVEVLVAHPDVQLTPPTAAAARQDWERRCAALDVIGLFAARRRPLSKSAGPLLLPTRRWSA